MNTSVYIDGFNLYFRALRGTRFKWLDLKRLADVLVPNDKVDSIHYFTARLLELPEDPSQPQRQQAYLRALETLPRLQIHYGVFRRREPVYKLRRQIPGLPTHVRVLVTEEKRSDVNLATRLLIDGFNERYEQAIVISNDSDLATPIQAVRDELGIKIGVVNPDGRNPTQGDLEESATFVKRLWPVHLRHSQFPDAITVGDRTITKPPSW